MTSFFQQLASQLQVATLYMQGCGKLHVTYSYRKLENQLTSYTCQFSLCQSAKRDCQRKNLASEMGYSRKNPNRGR